MRLLLIIVILISSKINFGQTNDVSRGNYFKTTSDEYFKKAIRPWKYQFIKSNSIGADSIQKIGQIIFWRSEPIFDKPTNKNFSPHISFDIYSSSYFQFLQVKATNIKMTSSCDTINKGGDIILIGQFVLLSSSSCVNCSSPSKVDYCRGIIKRVLSSVKNIVTDDWIDILNQLIIERRDFVN